MAHVWSTGVGIVGFGRLVSPVVFAAVLLTAKAAAADDATSAAADPPHAEGKPWTFDARVGPALLLKSQSHAPRHLFKPDVRLGGRISWSERWELGAAVDALIDSSEHYRVLGLMAHARFAPLVVGRFSLGASGALGAGYDADILHANLDASGRVAPYGFVALDGRWQLGRLLIGVEGAWQNLAIVQLGALIGVRLPG